MILNSLKEIEDNELLIYGLNQTFKKLSKTYPFVMGWEFDEGYEDYLVVLFLGVVIDYDKFIEYYPEAKIEPHVNRMIREEGKYKIYSLKTMIVNSENLDFDKEKINKIINSYYNILNKSNNDFTIEVFFMDDKFDFIPIEKRKDKITLSVNQFMFKTDKLADKNDLPF